VQPPELLVARERQVDLHALEVGPAVALAAEDPVERVVDLARAMRPELDVVRVHPRVHRGRHEPAALCVELGIRERNVRREVRVQAVERRPGAVALELDDVQRELVVPGDGAVLEFVGVLAAAASSSSSAPGATSNVSASTSMYSISTPYAVEQAERLRRGRGGRRRAVSGSAVSRRA